MTRLLKLDFFLAIFFTFIHLDNILEKKTKIALNQVYVPKLAIKVKSHKNST